MKTWPSFNALFSVNFTEERKSLILVEVLKTGLYFGTSIKGKKGHYFGMTEGVYKRGSLRTIGTFQYENLSISIQYDNYSGNCLSGFCRYIIRSA